MESRWDIVVLGCGPAGEKAAAQAAYFGKRVAIVDPLPVGGACVHTGTLPSKSLREAALVLSGARALGLEAVHIAVEPHTRLRNLLAHKVAVVRAEEQRMLDNLRRHGVTLVAGRGRLEGPDRVRVEPTDGGPAQVLRADVVLIATGTRPHRPSHLAFDHARIWDTDEVVEMEQLPSSLLVYGAGVIGCEYASIFAALGVEVTLVEPRDRVLPFVEDRVVETLLAAFTSRGIQVRTRTKLGACVADADGVDIGLTLDDGSTETLRAEQLLFAAGRTGNTEGLGLDAVGLTPDARGLLKVDARYHTGVGQIYAVGDVIGFPALVSTSMDQGRVAVCHAFGFAYKQRLADLLPYGIYTVPEVSMVGETTQALRAAGRPFEIGLATYGENARARLQGEDDGLLQLIFCPDTRALLGVHVVGAGASELVHTGMVAMQLGGTLDTFVDAVFNYPTLGELYKYAAYDGLGRLKRPTAGSGC